MNVKDIASYLRTNFNGNGELNISGIASLENAAPEDISFFIANSDFPSSFRGSCVLTDKYIEAKNIPAQIVVANPKLEFAKIASLILENPMKNPGISLTAVIHKSTEIDPTASIGEFCVIERGSKIRANVVIADGVKIGENVEIAENVEIHSNVVIERDSVVGANTVIHSGVVIGAEGFGFVRDSDGYVKFPQIGRVIIENDVEIGANSCIDRGSLGETRIGAGTKIDNMVQIAHNVSIGKRVVIASQTGISGSVVIEDDCIIGGQVGFGDHSIALAGAVIGAKAGVLPGKIVRPGLWWGVPIQPLKDYKRKSAQLNSIGRLIERIKVLEAKLAELESK